MQYRACAMPGMPHSKNRLEATGMGSRCWTTKRPPGVRIFIALRVLPIAAKVRAHGCYEPGTIEILGIDFGPPVVMAGCPFTVISYG